MIVGEASHCDEPKIRSEQIRTRSDDQIRVFVEFDCVKNNYRVSTFERVVTELLLGKKLRPKREMSNDRSLVWRNFAFVNYVSDRYVVRQRMEGSKTTFRPSTSDWISGGPAFEALLDNIEVFPRAILTVSKDVWDRMQANHRRLLTDITPDLMKFNHPRGAISVSWVNHPNAWLSTHEREEDSRKARNFFGSVMLEGK